MIHQAQTIELTTDKIEKLAIKDVIYAESSVGGAMGNAGGVMIYVIEHQKLIRYETNLFSDSDTYQKASEWLLKHQNEFKLDGIKVENVVLDYHYGGMGNHIFINKNIKLQKRNVGFLYSEGDLQYEIACSVLGVFNAVVYSMENPQED